MGRDKLWTWAGWTLAALTWVNVSAVAVAYMLYPGYVDHGESAISAMAWLMLQGQPVYLPLEAPDRITNIYGPLTYLWHAWPLALLGGGIVSSKVAAALGAALLTPALALLLRGCGALGGWALAFLTAIYTVNIAFPVVIRPDALLTLTIAVAVFAVARTRSWGWRATLLFGLAAGLAVNIKIHALIYLVPIGLYHLMGDWRRLPLAAAAAVAAAGFPFAFPLFPPGDYLSWFGPVAGKENQWLAKWIWEVALYLVPVLVVALGGRRGLPRREAIYLAAYVACLGLMLFPATKLGAGSHYYMPFLPLAADLLRRLARAGHGAPRQVALVGAVAVAVLIGSIQAERRFFKKLEWEKSAAVVAEIESILDAHRDRRVQMTVGRGQEDIRAGTQLSYHYYAWRNLPVYRGNPYTLDAGIMMELTKLKVPFPDEALRRVETCHTQVWLVPKDGAPFSLIGYYDQQIFPDSVREAFKTHYRKTESRTFFDTWECRPSPQ